MSLNDLKPGALMYNSPADIIVKLRDTLLPEVFQKLPILERSGLVVLYGSAARGELSEQSDIDILVFLPQNYLPVAMSAARELADTVWAKSAVDLGIPFTSELLFDEEIWNHDFLLHALQEALPVHDPLDIFFDRKKNLSVFPSEVQKEKIMYAGHQIIQWLIRLEQAVRRGDQLAAVSIRAKIIKFNIILLHLKHNTFWVANSLYTAAARQPFIQEFLPLIDACVKEIATNAADAYLADLVKLTHEEIIATGLLPKGFYANYKPWRMPLRYKISQGLL